MALRKGPCCFSDLSRVLSIIRSWIK